MADALSQGAQDEAALRYAGYSEDKIAQWKGDQMQTLQQAGYPQEKINKYFDIKEPDTTAMKDYVKKNIEAFHEGRKGPDGEKPKEAASFMEALDAGWESSVTGLGLAGKMPDKVLPEHAGFAMRMAAQTAQLAGDLPAMAAGGVLGGMVDAAAGTAVAPGVGTVAGAAYGGMAGAFAAPAGIRKLLMDHYEKGDITSAGDFMERLAGATWDAAKAGTVGALTAGAGLLAKPLGTAAGLGAEWATMTTAGAAMQGKLPEANDFIDGAVMIGGFHMAGSVLPGKLREIYKKTGERPEQVVEAARNDVTVRQELLSENADLPTQAAPTPDAEAPPPPETPKANGGDQGDGQSSLEEARSKILGRLGDQPVADKLGVKDLLTPEGRSKIALATRTALIDKLAPIEDAVASSGFENKELPNSQNAYILARNFAGWSGKATVALEHSTIDFKTGKPNGEGLAPILKDIGKENMQDFMAFALAKRSEERLDQGHETGISTDAAMTVIDADQARFGDTFKRLVDYSDRVMKYAADSGILGKKNEEFIQEKSKDYIPLLRVLDVDPFTGGPDKGKGSANQFQFMEGSEREILNPIEAIMNKTRNVIQYAERNRVAQAYGEMVETAPNGFALGERLEKPRGAANEISYMQDGERVTYKVPPDVAGAIKSLGADPGMSSFLVKMIAAPASWLRTGTVLNPDFLMRHFERTLFMRAVQSEGTVAPFKDGGQSLFMNVAGSLRSIGHIWKEDEVWQSFLSSGAAQRDIGGAIGYLKDNFWVKQEEGAPSVIQRMWNTPRTVKEGLEYMSMIADNASRVAEFKQQGGVGGNVEQITSAAYAAREATLDYNRIGAQMKAYSAVVPFINVGIQGNARMINGFMADKVGFSAKAMAMITLPSLITYALNHDDSRYSDAPNWEKDVYWLFPTNKWEKSANVADAISRPADLRRQLPDGSWEVNNGTTYRVMKPFELGILFGSLPERLMARYIGDNPRAMKDFMQTALHGVAPNVLPTALTPVLEQATNYNFFTGRPVVSSHNENLLPEYQYNEYTSSTAKALGSIFAKMGLDHVGPKNARFASPEVIDNYIHDWTGTGGQYALQAIGGIGRMMGQEGGIQKPDWTMAQWPIVKAFIGRYPSAQLQPIQDFYDDYDQAGKIAASIKTLQEHGQFDEAMKLQQNSQSDMLRLTDIKKAIGTQAKLLQMINEDPKMSGSDKRQLMDQTYYQMVIAAKQGNSIMDTYRKSVKKAGE